MRTRLWAVLLLGCVATAGCVRTDTELLDSSTAVISARGTAFDTPAKVFKTTVVEAAKLAQVHGFRYFAIVSERDATRVSTIYTPPRTTTSGTLDGTVAPFGGSFNAHYNETSFTTPGRTETFIKPGADVVIKFFHEGEVDPRASGIWDVQSVLSSADLNAGQQTNLAPSVTSSGLAMQVTAPTNNSVANAAIPTEVPPSPSQRFDQWQKNPAANAPN